MLELVWKSNDNMKTTSGDFVRLGEVDDMHNNWFRQEDKRMACELQNTPPLGGAPANRRMGCQAYAR